MSFHVDADRSLPFRSTHMMVVLGALAFLVAGCVPRTDLMDYRPHPGMDISPPAADEAVVVFLRPGRMAGAVSSSVFNDLDLVGVLMDYTYVAYHTKAGAHRFMVIGESTDFMDANLSAGKVYFAKIAPRIGWLRPRFSLAPITPRDPDWYNVGSWISQCSLITPNSAGRVWADANAPSIRERRDSTLPKWLAKDERPALYPEDGVALEHVPLK